MYPRSDDLIQAQFVAGRLASEGVFAAVFEAEFGSIRPGPGYFRVMLDRECPAEAAHVFLQWESGAYALESGTGPDSVTP